MKVLTKITLCVYVCVWHKATALILRKDLWAFPPFSQHFYILKWLPALLLPPPAPRLLQRLSALHSLSLFSFFSESVTFCASPLPPRPLSPSDECRQAATHTMRTHQQRDTLTQVTGTKESDKRVSESSVCLAVTRRVFLSWLYELLTTNWCFAHQFTDEQKKRPQIQGSDFYCCSTLWPFCVLKNVLWISAFSLPTTVI